MSETTDRKQSLELLLRGLKLPSFVTNHEEVALRAEKENWSFGQFLHHLAEIEHEDRRVRRIDRALKRSALPSDKTRGTLELQRFEAKVRRQFATLCEGDFVHRAENILAFGLPGRGKTHMLCAIGHELIMRGYRVLFIPAYQLVQRLLSAKKELTLEKELRRLDNFDAVIVDDIGYVQQNRDEMEVLFTFFGERYERRSVLISSNLVFSQWDRIFKDPMTTAAAIDRLIHHATILELTCKHSFRKDKAQRHSASQEEQTAVEPEKETSS